MAGVVRKGLLQKLQRHPTMFRFWLLADSIILLAMITTIIVSFPNLFQSLGRSVRY